MTCCCASFGDAVERQFSRKKAAKDLARSSGLSGGANTIAAFRVFPTRLAGGDPTASSST